MSDLGEASYVLGIEIIQARSRKLLGLSQRSYINQVLKRFHMQDCLPGEAPIIKGDKYSVSQCP